MKKTTLGLSALAPVLLGVSTASLSAAVISSLPFVDSFDDGVLADSDTVTDAWTNLNTGGYFTESGGELVVDIPNNTGSTEFRFMETEETEAFDFYAAPKTFSFSGVDFDKNGTTENLLNIRLATTGNNDFIWLRFRSDGQVSLVERENGVNNQLFSELGLWDGTLTSISLTLDGQDFSASWTSSLGGAESRTGTTNISESQWGGATSSPALLSIQGQTSVAVPNFNTSFTIGAVEVIPEPGTYAALFGFAALVTVMLRRR